MHILYHPFKLSPCFLVTFLESLPSHKHLKFHFAFADSSNRVNQMIAGVIVSSLLP